MEFEERNPKPEPTTKSGLPLVVLFVLIGIICLLLYAGWNMMSDDASKVSEFREPNAETQNPSDTTQLLEDGSAVNGDAVHHVAEEGMPDKKSETLTTSKVETKPEIEGPTINYTMRSGETFYALANRFGMSPSTLKKANPDIDLNSIKVGTTKVTIPIQAIHTVGPGDILSVISKKYGVTIGDIMGANHRTKNYAERGEKLIIPKKRTH